MIIIIILDCCYVYACQKSMIETESIRLKIPLLSSHYIQEECFSITSFSWISVSDKYVLSLMNCVSSAIHVIRMYDLLLFRDTLVQLNFLMYI